MSNLTSARSQPAAAEELRDDSTADYSLKWTTLAEVEAKNPDLVPSGRMVEQPPPKAKSDTWINFLTLHYMEGMHMRRVGLCKLCAPDKVKLISISKDNRSNLSKHFKKCHEKKDERPKEQRQQTLARFIPAKLEQERANALLIKLMIANNLPLRFVESPATCQFVFYLSQDMVKVPNRKQVSKLIRKAHDSVIDLLMKQLRKAKGIHLTFDGWTSKYGKTTYMSLSVSFINDQFQRETFCVGVQHLPESHTADNLVRWIEKNLQQPFSFLDEDDDDDQPALKPDNVMSATTDGASNVKKAVSLLKLPWCWCFSHRLHLVMQAAMDLATPQKKRRNPTPQRAVYDKVRDMNSIFSHSNLLYNEFMDIGRQLKQPLSVVDDVETRWGSVYDMFKRTLQLRQHWSVFFRVIAEDQRFKPANRKRVASVSTTEAEWISIAHMTEVLARWRSLQEKLQDPSLTVGEALNRCLLTFKEHIACSRTDEAAEGYHLMSITVIWLSQALGTAGGPIMATIIMALPGKLSVGHWLSTFVSYSLDKQRPNLADLQDDDRPHR